MMPLAHYQALGRQLEQARSAGDETRIAEIEAQLRDAPAVIRYLYLRDVPPPALGETPPPPAEQLEQLLGRVRAPVAVSEPASKPSGLDRSSSDVIVPALPPSSAHGSQRVEAMSVEMRSRPPRALQRTDSLHNVLVVDPDERILSSWKRAARERNVFTAADAATARECAHTERPDLAIVELRIGNTSGIDLIRDLKRELPDLMVVLCSGYLSIAASVAAVRAGADIVVFKPITFREILKRIENSAEDPDLEDTPTLARAEWEHIMRVLADCNGNTSMAARRLGIYRSSLQRRLRKYASRS